MQSGLGSGAGAGAELPPGALTAPLSPQYAFQEEQEKPLPVHGSQCCECCPVPTPSLLPTPTPRDFKGWASHLLWDIGPQPEWGSTSPHSPSPSPFLLSFPCLLAFLCCVPAPRWVSLLWVQGRGRGGTGAAEEGSPWGC